MTDYYAPGKRILYHLDGTMAFYRTTANEYFEMSAADLALLNRNRGDTELTTPPSPGKDFTFFFPTTMWIQGIFINDYGSASYATNGKEYFETGGQFEIWVSPNTTGLDDGDWYRLNDIPNGQYYVTYYGNGSADNALWAFRQAIKELMGQRVLQVRALRIVMTPSSRARIHLYGSPADPTPLLGDLVLVRDDGSPLTVDELWLGDIKHEKNPSEDVTLPSRYTPSVSFRVKNVSTRTAQGAAIEFGYLQSMAAEVGVEYLPKKEIRVNGGAWAESLASQVHTETIGDLAPGATSSQLFTYRLRMDPMMYYFGSWTTPYAQPIVLRPTVTGWAA